MQVRVFAYHKKVMEQRGGNIWVELDGKENFKHYFAPTLPAQLNSVEKYLLEKPWYHTYYLETLKSIYLDLK